MADAPVSPSDFNATRRLINIDQAIQLLTNDKSRHVREDIQQAFVLLGAAHHSRRFYPSMDPVTKDMVDPALIAGFMRLNDEWSRQKFTFALKEAGLPVIQLTDHTHVLEALERVDATYRWSWDTQTPPSPLSQFLTKKKIVEFQEMSSYLRYGWYFTGTTDVFAWSQLNPEAPPVIKKGGIKIVVTPRSKITGVPEKSLTLKNVTIRPFVAPGMTQRPERLSLEKRRIVVVNALDRLERGYSK